ncbi:hypothetical protein [Mangrovihabitans endophyticus]|uniref:Uncharacterized protein n=1 Tax=Mangrovihabitans endophyticus TaxID=1751298 RepID=A0A8J3BXT8_9ACTN|nr:hypothetical protein [Mangrovihabitans endophyticus]GGK89538.1 hypothetical protein GCM10012284_24320 [Mangrovihabitans endophyticus]
MTGSAPVVGVDRVSGVPVCSHGDDADACQMEHRGSQAPPPGTPAPSGPPPQPSGPVPTGPSSAGPGRCAAGRVVDLTGEALPRIGEVTRNAEQLGAQLLTMLRRPYDPRSVPDAERDPVGAAYVAARLEEAVRDVRRALRSIGAVTDAGLPAAGSAVRAPGGRHRRADPPVESRGEASASSGRRDPGPAYLGGAR